MKYNGMDYNDYLVEKTLANMSDKELDELWKSSKKIK